MTLPSHPPKLPIPEQPPTLFHCATCGAAEPWPSKNPHSCKVELTSKQRRRLAAERRLAAMRQRAEREPRPCEFCDRLITPGTAHFCPGSRDFPDPAGEAVKNWQTANLIQMLKAAGVKLERTDD